MARLTRYHGRLCPYCERQMDIFHQKLLPTRDHIIPKIRGGRDVLICCKFCNNLKGHMMPDEWDAFRAAFTGYWNFSPRDRRAALAKHKRDYVPGRGHRKAARNPIIRRRAPVVVPPELIFLDAQLRNYPAPQQED